MYIYVLSLNVYYERIVYIKCIELCTLFKKLYMFIVYNNVHGMYKIENLCTLNTYTFIYECAYTFKNIYIKKILSGPWSF